MTYRAAILGFLAALFLSGGAAVENNERDLKVSVTELASEIVIISFDVALSGSGNPNRQCDPSEQSIIVNLLKGSLNELGASGLGISSDQASVFSVVDLILESEIVTDDPDEIETRRRLAGTWVFNAAATCFRCSDYQRNLSFLSKTKVSSGIVVPEESIRALETTLLSYVSNEKDSCMASDKFNIKVDLYTSSD